ncbi:hypothetical protein, partial [Actinomyces sp.]|uniref:hypothetical protein n=1 Tax=Actinomyces sp. TaxID=29317 RepID=UPI00361392B0
TPSKIRPHGIAYDRVRRGYDRVELGTTTRFYVRPGGIAYDHVPRDPDEESPAQPHPHDTKNPF